jgi:hypothetical protein
MEEEEEEKAQQKKSTQKILIIISVIVGVILCVILYLTFFSGNSSSSNSSSSSSNSSSISSSNSSSSIFNALRTNLNLSNLPSDVRFYVIGYIGYRGQDGITHVNDFQYKKSPFQSRIVKGSLVEFGWSFPKNQINSTTLPFETAHITSQIPYVLEWNPHDDVFFDDMKTHFENQTAVTNWLTENNRDQWIKGFLGTRNNQIECFYDSNQHRIFIPVHSLLTNAYRDTNYEIKSNWNATNFCVLVESAFDNYSMDSILSPLHVPMFRISHCADLKNCVFSF